MLIFTHLLIVASVVALWLFAASAWRDRYVTAGVVLAVFGVALATLLPRSVAHERDEAVAAASAADAVELERLLALVDGKVREDASDGMTREALVAAHGMWLESLEPVGGVESSGGSLRVTSRPRRVAVPAPAGWFVDPVSDVACRELVTDPHGGFGTVRGCPS